jgi:hypothetical protein
VVKGHAGWRTEYGAGCGNGAAADSRKVWNPWPCPSRNAEFYGVLSFPAYRHLPIAQRCQVSVAEDTGRFPAYIDLYINMLDMQLTYDALRILHFDTDTLGAMAQEMALVRLQAGLSAMGRKGLPMMSQNRYG